MTRVLVDASRSLPPGHVQMAAEQLIMLVLEGSTISKLTVWSISTQRRVLKDVKTRMANWCKLSRLRAFVLQYKIADSIREANNQINHLFEYMQASQISVMDNHLSDLRAADPSCHQCWKWGCGVPIIIEPRSSAIRGYSSNRQVFSGCSMRYTIVFTHLSASRRFQTPVTVIFVMQPQARSQPTWKSLALP
jgi:hypothetical protein